MKFKDIDLNYYYGEVMLITDSKDEHKTNLLYDYESFTLDEHLLNSGPNQLNK